MSGGADLPDVRALAHYPQKRTFVTLNPDSIDGVKGLRMDPRPIWKLRLAIALERLVFVDVGGWIMVQYIDLTHPEIRGSLKDVAFALMVMLWILGALIGYLRPAENRQQREPSPRWSGTSVVLMTGLAGSFYVARNFEEDGLTWAALIGLATLVIAAAVWRFASVNSHQIGEARFDIDS